jgi:hypothetical protein
MRISVALGLDQNVGEDRNRVLAFDDALEKLQFSQKLILPDNKFHRLVVTSAAEQESAAELILLTGEKKR